MKITTIKKEDTLTKIAQMARVILSHYKIFLPLTSEKQVQVSQAIKPKYYLPPQNMDEYEWHESLNALYVAAGHEERVAAYMKTVKTRR